MNLKTDGCFIFLGDDLIVQSFFLLKIILEKTVLSNHHFLLKINYGTYHENISWEICKEEASVLHEMLILCDHPQYRKLHNF